MKSPREYLSLQGTWLVRDGKPSTLMANWTATVVAHTIRFPHRCVVVLLRVDFHDGETTLLELPVGEFRRLEWVDTKLPLKAMTYSGGPYRHLVYEAIIANGGIPPEVSEDKFDAIKAELLEDLCDRSRYYEMSDL